MTKNVHRNLTALDATRFSRSIQAAERDEGRAVFRHAGDVKRIVAVYDREAVSDGSR
ncbi:hypothetical protein [Stieleria varia]|nr:hypothetical protein [Stieleria varia]